MEKISKKQILIFALSLVIIALSTFSYAFFYSVDDSEESIATTDCFKLEFEDQDEIDIEKGYPLSEEEGSLLKPYQFTIRNVCNAIEEYQINIETINDSTISTNNIRYKLDSRLSQKLGEQEEVSEYVNSNISESRKIEMGELNKNGEKTYSLRLWIDEESTKEETANKTYASKVVIKAVPSVDITLNTNGGTVSQSVVRKIVGRPIGELEDPTKAGYQFIGWYYDSEFTKEVNEEDIVGSKTNNIYAKYLANTDTRYTVEHYQMDTNGNYSTTPTESENLFGTTDTLVTPNVKTYTGFKSPSAEVVNIDGDGSRVVKYYYERNKYTQITQGRYMNTSGNYGDYTNVDTKDVYYGAPYSYSSSQTAEYNAASVASYTVTEAKTNSVDISRKQYTQTTQGRYMNTSGNYGDYTNVDTKDVYYGAPYSYSSSQTAEYNAASVAAYTVTEAKTNSIDISRRQYTQITQGRYMNTSGNYGDYTNVDTKDVYYGADYSYSKDATAEYNAASVAAYTVTEAKTNSVDISRKQYTQTTQGRYMNTSGNYGDYTNVDTKDVYYGADYSYSKDATAEYNAASVASYTVTGAKTNSVDISRRQYAQTTQGRYMNSSGAYGSYSNLETKNVYYGASYSYSKAATAEYNAASVASYTVTGAKTNSVDISRRQYAQTTQGRYMNTAGNYGSYSNLESKNVYYGASYSYSKAATAEYNAASVAAYTVNAAKTNQISFSRRQYAQTTQGRYMNTAGNYGSYSNLESKNVYYGASYSYSKAATAEYNAASVAAYTVNAAKTNQISFSRRQYTQTTQGRYMNTAGNYGSYSNLESKNVYYGASYSYSKAATAEYNAASVAAYTVKAAKTNQISFSRRQYTLTFNANGGSVSPTSRNVYYNAATTLPSPSRTNYSFNGWYTATSGGSKYGNAGASYTVTGAKTMYAQWLRNQLNLLGYSNHPAWNLTNFSWMTCDGCGPEAKTQLYGDSPGGCCTSSCNATGTTKTAITAAAYNLTDLNKLIVEWWHSGMSDGPSSINVYLCSSPSSCTGSLASHSFPKDPECSGGSTPADSGGGLTANISNYNGNYYVKVVVTHDPHGGGHINIGRVYLTR